MNLSEKHLYGSSRLGVWNRQVNMDAVLPTPYTTPGLGTINSTVFERGSKAYELSNHLGNVLVTISDRKFGLPSPGNSSLIDHYEADVLSTQDYYPFGMAMPGRKSGGYRYGFNGKENDTEVKSDGNSYDFGNRIYDPRLGRFLSIDRLITKTPFYSPFLYAGNKPIVAVDQDGDLEVIIHVFEKVTDPQSGKTTTRLKYSSKIEVTTLEDIKGISRTPAEVNVILLSTATTTATGNQIQYNWTTSLNKVEDVKNTGLNRSEQADAEDNSVGRALNWTFKKVAKGIGTYQLTEAAVGEDLNTGETKAAAERWIDFASGIASIASMGRAGATDKLKSWGTKKLIDMGVEEGLKYAMKNIGLENKSQVAVLTYYVGRFILDAKNGKLKNITDLIIKSTSLGAKGADYLVKQLKSQEGIDLNVPLDKKAALSQILGSQLSQYNSGSDKTAVDDYTKTHK